MLAQMEQGGRTWTIELVGFKKKLIITEPGRQLEVIISYDKMAVTEATKSVIEQLRNSGVSALKLWLYDFEFVVESVVSHSGFEAGVKSMLGSDGLVMAIGLSPGNPANLREATAVDLTIALLIPGPEVTDMGVNIREMIPVAHFTLEQVNFDTIVRFFKDFQKIINAW